MGESKTSVNRVILTPCLVGGSLVDAACLRVIEQWRDGCLMPVASPGLLRRYLSLLSGLGVPRPQLRRWAWWFTATEKCAFIDIPDLRHQPLPELCQQIAGQAGVQLIIHSGRLPPCPGDATPDPVTRWISAAEYLGGGTT